MRLLGPYLFILVGALLGVITTSVFRNPLTLVPNIIAGVVGSFIGLWVRDALDIQLGGNLSGALFAAAMGALLATVGLNLAIGRRWR